MYGKKISRIAVAQERKEPLNQCNLCGMHIPSGRLIKHHRMQQCNRNAHMRWRRRDVKISSQCTEESFSLMGEDKSECIKGVETFKYLGQVLDRSDNDWPAVFWDVGKALRVWSRIGKLLRR